MAGLGTVGVLLRTPILTWIGRQLVDVDPLAPSDAIVVLAGGVPERIIGAADLYAQHLAPLVALTRDAPPSDWEVLRGRGVAVEDAAEQRVRILRELGVPPDAVIVLEPWVDTTMDEAQTVAAWARDHRLRSLIVVTSSFHTDRAKFTFRRVLRGTGITVRLSAASLDSYQPDSWWHSHLGWARGVTELQKQLYYRLRY